MWSSKIEGWQWRELAEPNDVLAGLPDVAEPAVSVVLPSESERSEDALATGIAPGESAPDLRVKYSRFLVESKRDLARSFASWIQDQAKLHYVPDGPLDHWATLEETLLSNGDDCDGLELLTFRGLRELGFRDDEVFRSIVLRPSDGQHHMVTLWFEDRDDPWVIDPSGAMTSGMPRMSEIPNWVPLKVFAETVEYTVKRGPPSSTADLAANH